MYYVIEKNLLVHWSIEDILQNIIAPLMMHGVNNYEEGLKKDQQIETNEEWALSSNNRKLEGKIERMKNFIQDLVFQTRKRFFIMLTQHRIENENEGWVIFGDIYVDATMDFYVLYQGMEMFSFK